MKTKNIVHVLSMVLGAGAFAGVQELQTLSRNEAHINVAQVQATFTIKKTEQRNPTRISLVVKDLGGSTDVSPTLGLYLVFWQDGEMGDATASFDLGNTFSLVDYNDTMSGKLVLKLKQYGDHGFKIETVTIDYSEFAAKFAKEASTIEEDFSTEWVPGSIYAKTAQ